MFPVAAVEQGWDGSLEEVSWKPTTHLSISFQPGLAVDSKEVLGDWKTVSMGQMELC